MQTLLKFFLTIIILATINACNEIPIEVAETQSGKIVFVVLDTGTYRSNIYQMDLKGENVKQLTFANEILDTTDFPSAGRIRGSASEPRWSPDGKKIVYSESQGPDESHIVIMNEDGSSKKTLTNVGAYCIRPRWNPQGDRILYLRGTYSGAIIATSIVDTNGVYYGGSSFDIHIAPDSRVFEDDSIWYDTGDSQWYLDGQHLYVWGNIGGFPSIPVCGENTNGEIFLLEIATGKVVSRLTHNRVDECGFEMSPAGTQLLVVRGLYQTNRKIYLMHLDDPSLSAITTGKNDNLPRWSNDGSIIVFAKDINDDPYVENRKIFLVNPNQPLKETQVSSLKGDQPDIFIQRP